MKKSPKTAPNPYIKTEPSAYSPTQSQIDTLARRLMPEIKKFFAERLRERVKESD